METPASISIREGEIVVQSTAGRYLFFHHDPDSQFACVDTQVGGAQVHRGEVHVRQRDVGGEVDALHGMTLRQSIQ